MEECSVDFAAFPVNQASAYLASRRVTREEKLEPLRHHADFGWGTKVMRGVGARNLAAIMQRAAIHLRAKELANAVKMRFHRL